MQLKFTKYYVTKLVTPMTEDDQQYSSFETATDCLIVCGTSVLVCDTLKQLTQFLY